MNLIKVTPNELAVALEACIKANTPVFVWGSPGIGKSSIVQQVGKKLGFTDFRDIRLTQRDPTDVGCMPFPDPNTGQVKLLPPDYYVKESVYTDEEAEKIRQKLKEDPNYRPPRRTLYFFDELNAAPQAVQATGYQIVLDRQIGPYPLGQFDFVVAAGNLMTDRGVVYKMPTPLANRFIHLELVVDHEEWLRNMMDPKLGYKIHPFVLGFIKFKGKKALHDFDPKKHDKAFATPRSWKHVSDHIYENWGKVPHNIMSAIVAGAVGEGLAHEFMAYAEKAAALPAVTDVLKGKVKELNTNNHAIQYAFTVSLAYALRDVCEKEAAKKGVSLESISPSDLPDYVHEYFDNFFFFIMDNLPREMVVMAYSLIVDLPHDIDGKGFDKFFEEYSSIVHRASKV